MAVQPKARVQANFKIQAASKRRVDLMANALGVDKGAVIDEAIALLARQKSPELKKFLDDARASLQGLDARQLGAVYAGKKPSPKYAGGPVPR